MLHFVQHDKGNMPRCPEKSKGFPGLGPRNFFEISEGFAALSMTNTLKLYAEALNFDF
jgi:hypothetical protein